MDEPEPSSRTTICLELDIGLATLAVADFGIFWILKQNWRITLPATAEPLLTEIANLDDDFETGNVQKSQYQKKRQVLIEKIEQMI